MAAIPNVPTETKAPKKVKKTQIVFSEEMEEVRQDKSEMTSRSRKRIMKNQKCYKKLTYISFIADIEIHVCD